MTDYDRGAYTPQTDAPLAFDPRRPSERRPMPMALIGSAAVLVILLAGVAMVYRGGVRHAGESPRPVGEPVMAVKTAPTAAQSAADSAAAPAPAANLDVYSQGQAATAPADATAAGNQVAAAPTFAPASEQPTARPGPSAATVAMLAKPSAPTRIVRPPTPTESSAQTAASSARPIVHKPAASVVQAKAEPARAVAAPVLRPAVHPKVDDSELAAAGSTRMAAANDAPTAAASPAKAAQPSSATTTVQAMSGVSAKSAATAKSAAVAKSSATGNAVVQIGAFSSSALADKGYADVSSTMPDRMGGKAKHVQPLDKDGTTLYRTWLSGFASRADAVAFCEALKAKGKTCLVKG